MIAVVDETSPEVAGGILYTVVSAVLIADEVSAKEAVSEVLGPARKRPFHWNQEGPVAREAMRDCIETLGVVGRAVVVQCGRRSQERARAVAMSDTVRHLLDEGCSDLLIESRSSIGDGRDAAVILDTLRVAGAAGSLSYEWRTKDEPLIWIADAVGGAVREHLLGEPSEWFEPIRVVTDLAIEYRSMGS